MPEEKDVVELLATGEWDLDTPLVHICEGCGKTETLTPRQAFDAGWDYPPVMAQFTIVSPRTCSGCTIDKTLYWRILQFQQEHGADATYQVSEEEKPLLDRILAEPESIVPKDEDL